MNFLRNIIIFGILLVCDSSTSSAGDKKPLSHKCPTQSIDKKLVISVLAVGQGDSTFIRTPNGTTVLIDAGNPGRGNSDIIPTLKKCYKVSSIDYVILTHPHADHFGGLPEILNAFSVKKAIYDTGYGKGVKFEKFAALADSTHKRSIPKLGETAIVSGDGVKFKLVAINGEILGGKRVNVFKKNGEPTDVNSVSIAIVIEYGKFRYFTAGDISGGGNNTPDVESPVADVVGRVDVMKSNHHGSATANNPYLMNKLRPKQILISVGDGETNSRYHLPNEHTIALFMSLPFVEKVYQTAKGEGRAPASIQAKVKNENTDITIIATPEKYWLGQHEFNLN